MPADRPEPTDRLGYGVLGWMARVLGVFAATGFVALLVYGVLARAPENTIDDALASKRPVAAPAFDLSVLDGGRPGPLAPVWTRAAADGKVALSELRGTPLVLNYWASWCDPCRAEAPVLQRGWEAARRRGVLFLGIDVQDLRADAKQFVREFRQDFPHVRDPDKDTGRRWGVTGIPETFFVSRQGQVVGHVIGALTARQLADGVDAALAGRAVQARRGGEQLPTR